MPSIRNNPEHWRARAAEARAVAESLTSPEAREHMIACAESYERLAALAEQGPLMDPALKIVSSN